MNRDLLDQFWRDYYQCPEKDRGSLAIDNFIKDFRNTLDPSNQTAQAIDRGDSLEKIMQCAFNEEFFKFAQTLHFVDSKIEILNNIYNGYHQF